MDAKLPASAQALDVRILHSIPTPVADALISRGCRQAPDVTPEALKEVLAQHHVAGLEQRANSMLSACRQEAAKDAWRSADSALSLLRKTARPKVTLPCTGLNQLLGNALRGGALLEVFGLPGSGKTQFCLQLCAAVQIPCDPNISIVEAVFIDTEGSFVPQRYLQVCEALLAERRPHLDPPAAAAQLEAVMRSLHVCRAYDATELYSTIKQLGAFIKGRRRPVGAVVVDSIAFSFRHELMDNTAQRARVLAEIAGTLRQLGADHDLLAVGREDMGGEVTNHMTTRFGREDTWLAPALGETWAHQASTQLRLEKMACWQQPGLGRATLTKSVEKAACSCAYRISHKGLRDDGPEAMPVDGGCTGLAPLWGRIA
ncbi:unnamed protein product [Cladocopium goreaui]|uniref:DNA repair protein RAD51 homolog 3 n=1 Tax=Cladocopium goreaui TaxID=2562237 RepID=A0A9P1BT34_9DINO|nr:unnamed protein product [Cladocopium goreaui]